MSPPQKSGKRTTTSTNHREDLRMEQQGFWRRHSWKLLLGVVLIIGVFGIGDVFRGIDADPAIPLGVTGLTPDEIRATSQPLATLIDLQVRSGGLHLAIMSVLWSMILLIPFRRGERWAWYTMWTFPIWALVVSISFLFVELQPDVPLPPPAISGWVLFALTALTLLATRRAFFRTEGPQAVTGP